MEYYGKTVETSLLEREYERDTNQEIRTCQIDTLRIPLHLNERSSRILIVWEAIIFQIVKVGRNK